MHFNILNLKHHIQIIQVKIKDVLNMVIIIATKQNMIILLILMIY